MLKLIIGLLFSSLTMFSFADDNDKSGDGDTEGSEGDSGENDDVDTDSEKDKGEDDDKGETGTDEPKKTHTEKDVNTAAAKARTGAEEKIAKKLGVTLEEAAEMIKKQQDAEAADRTELENSQKALEKLTEEKGEVDGTVKTLLSRVISGAVKLEARKADYGILPEVIDDLWKLIQNDEKIVEMLKIDEDTFEVTGIDKAIKAAIKGREYMLVEEDDPKKKPGSPPKTPRKPKPRDNSQEPVKRRAKTL